MKKLLILFTILPMLSWATNYTSKASGDWSSSSTWSPAGIPGQNDNVTIASGNTVTELSAESVNNITVNLGGTFSPGYASGLPIYGVLTNNGTVNSNGRLGMRGLGTVITGSGSFASFTGTIYFNNKSESIASGVTLYCSTITLNPNLYGKSVRVYNNGTIICSSNITNNAPSVHCCWYNNTGSSLSVKGFIFGNTTDTLIASPVGNTVTYTGTASNSVKSPATSFYNLTCSSTGTISLSANTIVTNALSITAGTLDVTASNYNLTVGGNFTNNATVNNRSNTVTLNSSSTQTLGGTKSTTFNNLTISPTTSVVLGIAQTVKGNLSITSGTLDCENYQITGNATGTLTMAAGTTMLLGSTTIATNILFPTTFTTAHITLTAGSTVNYQADGAQTISTTPTYANLTASSGSSASVKTPSGTPLTVAGNLVVNSNANVTVSAGTMTVGGTATVNSGGTVTYTTGTFNVTGLSTIAGTVTYSGNGSYTSTGGLTVSSGGLISETGGSLSSGAATGITGSVTFSSNGTFSSTGVLTVNSSGNVAMGTGTLTASSTSTINSGGVISLTSGNYNATGLVTNSGTLSITTGTDNFMGGFTESSTGALTGTTGNLTVTGASNITGSVTFSGNGNYSTSGTFNVFSGGNVSMGTGTLTTSSTSTISSGGTVSITSGNYNATGLVTNSGALSITTGTDNFMGGFTENSGGTMTGTTGNLTVTGNSNITGSVTFSGNGNYSTSGTFTVNSGGNVSMGTGTLTTSSTSTINSGGTVSLTTGIYNATGLVTNSGSLTFTTGTGNLAGGLTNSGTTSFSGAGNLNIGGDLTNNNVMTLSTSLVNMNGSINQNIGGSSEISFYNLQINQGSSANSVTLNSNEQFTNVLTMVQGTLASSGANEMELISNASGTGRIAQVPVANASITAKFLVDRFENFYTTSAYATMGTPVASETIGDWYTTNQSSPDLFYMSIYGASDCCAVSGGDTAYSVEYYQENTGKYVPLKRMTNNITPGEGLFAYLGTSLTTITDPFTYKQNGVPAVGSYTVNVTNTAGKGNGFNLVANPFCSPLSYSQLQLDNGGLGLNGTYYVMESSGSSSNGAWLTLNSATSPTIAMCQGFGVVVNAGILTFSEDQKTSGNPGFERPLPGNDDNNNITLLLSNDSNEYSCQVTCAFGPDYVKTFQPNEDGYFITPYYSGVPMMWTTCAEGYAIQYKGLPDNETVLDIPLTTEAQVKANYILKITNPGSLNSYQCVCLVDPSTGNIINNFTDNPEYRFSLAKGGDQRNFILRLKKLSKGESCSPVTADASSNVNIFPSQYGATISFNMPETSNAVISVYNMLGQKVMDDINTAAYINTVPVNLNSGQLYIVKVTTNEGTVVKKIYR